MPTRFGTWTEAVTFYSEHFEAVKSVVAKFPSESAVRILECIQQSKTGCSAAYIPSNSGGFWRVYNV
jgi:hypothetical protein